MLTLDSENRLSPKVALSRFSQCTFPNSITIDFFNNQKMSAPENPRLFIIKVKPMSRKVETKPIKSKESVISTNDKINKNKYAITNGYTLTGSCKVQKIRTLTPLALNTLKNRSFLTRYNQKKGQTAKAEISFNKRFKLDISSYVANKMINQ